MTKDEIMALADEFAAATSNHYLAGERDAIKWQLMVDARAALEAALASQADALTEKQEQVLGTKTWIANGVVITQYLTAADIYKDPAPVNQQLLDGEVKELLTLALEAVKLLGHIRCHPRRHDLERSWLTEADRVIGYWDDTRTHQRISAAIAAVEGKV